jgi:hypothetical protein
VCLDIHLDQEAALAKLDLKQYARLGAEARVAQLLAELAEIHRTFPGLRNQAISSSTVGDVERAPARRKRKPMTDAQKREVSLRMTKYWASRRKAKD